MDAQPQTRSVERDRSPQTPQRAGQKQIVIPMTQAEYDCSWKDPVALRKHIEEHFKATPELFPPDFQTFQMHGFLRESKKLPGVRLRKIKLKNKAVYELRPSFVMSYMVGTVDDLAHPLLLAAIGCPYWVIVHIFGKNEMFWYRIVERLGRNSLVGCTVRDPLQLPEHIAADEHITDWCGNKGYIATVAGKGCLLGLALTSAADEEHLTAAYKIFAEEARNVRADYSPQTVNTDGWAATQNAFKTLFDAVTIIICFLHGFLRIRDRARKNFELGKEVWRVYWSQTAETFRARMKDLKEWCRSQELPTTVMEMVQKLINRTDDYVRAYEHPNCHRTSNQVDRLMNRVYRDLYSGRGLHGHQVNSERHLRGWALLQNYRPFAPRSGVHRDFACPADRLNNRSYHPDWLQNLNIATSLMGYRAPAPAIR